MTVTRGLVLGARDFHYLEAAVGIQGCAFRLLLIVLTPSNAPKCRGSKRGTHRGGGGGPCTARYFYTTTPPRVNGPGHVSSFERGGHWQGGPCFFVREGGGIDTRTGGPLTRVLVKNPKKIFVYAFSSLCHWCKRGGDPCWVPLASLWWLWSARKPPFAIFSCFYTIFLVVLNICFPCLSFFTHASTQ